MARLHCARTRRVVVSVSSVAFISTACGGGAENAQDIQDSLTEACSGDSTAEVTTSIQSVFGGEYSFQDPEIEDGRCQFGQLWTRSIYPGFPDNYVSFWIEERSDWSNPREVAVNGGTCVLYGSFDEGTFSIECPIGEDSALVGASGIKPDLDALGGGIEAVTDGNRQLLADVAAVMLDEMGVEVADA